MIHTHVNIHYEVACDSCYKYLHIYDYNGYKELGKFNSMDVILHCIKENGWKYKNGKMTCSFCIKQKLRAKYK